MCATTPSVCAALLRALFAAAVCCCLALATPSCIRRRSGTTGTTGGAPAKPTAPSSRANGSAVASQSQQQADQLVWSQAQSAPDAADTTPPAPRVKQVWTQASADAGCTSAVDAPLITSPAVTSSTMLKEGLVSTGQAVWWPDGRLAVVDGMVRLRAFAPNLEPADTAVKSLALLLTVPQGPPACYQPCNTLLFADGNGNLCCLGPDLAGRWKTKVQTNGGCSGIVIDGDKAFSNLGTFVNCVDAKSGAVLWSTDIKETHVCRACVNNGLVYGLGEHTLTALKESDGSTASKMALGQVNGMGRVVALDKARVCVSNGESQLLVVGPGTEKRELLAGGGQSWMLYGASAGWAILASDDTIHGVSVDSGNRWEYKLHGMAGLCGIIVNGALCYVTDSTGLVYCLGLQDGSLKWQLPTNVPNLSIGGLSGAGEILVYNVGGKPTVMLVGDGGQ